MWRLVAHPTIVVEGVEELVERLLAA